MFFVTYTDHRESGDEAKKVLQFYTIEKLFEWLQAWVNEFELWPENLSVYKATPMFDGSGMDESGANRI